MINNLNKDGRKATTLSLKNHQSNWSLRMKVQMATEKNCVLRDQLTRLLHWSTGNVRIQKRVRTKAIEKEKMMKGGLVARINLRGKVGGVLRFLRTREREMVNLSLILKEKWMITEVLFLKVKSSKMEVVLTLMNNARSLSVTSLTKHPGEHSKISWRKLDLSFVQTFSCLQKVVVEEWGK